MSDILFQSKLQWGLTGANMINMGAKIKRLILRWTYFVGTKTKTNDQKRNVIFARIKNNYIDKKHNKIVVYSQGLETYLITFLCQVA